MKKTHLSLAIITATIFAALLAYTSLFSGVRYEPLFKNAPQPHTFETLAIADMDQALTFARTQSGMVIAVTAYENAQIKGVDLSTTSGRNFPDPIEIFNDLGYEAIADVIRNGPQITMDIDQLILPVDLTSHHIAAGTNFPEHANEAGVEDGPFLFPKLTSPTGPYDPVSIGGGLLDYEVELGWVTMAPLNPGENPQYMGLILANDYTDREILLHSVDTGNVGSGAGFTTGKSLPGFLPVGNLFVIPQDFQTFSRDVKLALYVNGALRQRAPVGSTFWNFNEILAQTWAQRSVTWEHNGEQVPLFAGQDVIGARVVILSGTPEGTIFSELSWAQKLSGVLSWVLGGWGESVPDHAIETYITEARKAAVYLQPEDEVVIHVDHLGIINNRIVE